MESIDPIYYNYDILYNERIQAERSEGSSDEPIPSYYRRLIEVIQYYSYHPEKLETLNPDYRDLVLNTFVYLSDMIDVPFVDLSPEFFEYLKSHLFIDLYKDTPEECRDIDDLMNYLKILINLIPMMRDRDLYLGYLFNYILQYKSEINSYYKLPKHFLYYDVPIYNLIISILQIDFFLPSIQNFLISYFPNEYRSFSDPTAFLSITDSSKLEIIYFYMNHTSIFSQMSLDYQKTLILQYILINRSWSNLDHIRSSDDLSYILNLILPIYPLHEDDFTLRLSFIISILPSIKCITNMRIILHRIRIFLVHHELIWKHTTKYTKLLNLYKEILQNNINIYPELYSILRELFPEGYDISYPSNINKRPLEEEFEEERRNFKKVRREIDIRMNPHKRFYEEEEHEEEHEDPLSKRRKLCGRRNLPGKNN